MTAIRALAVQVVTAVREVLGATAATAVEEETAVKADRELVVQFTWARTANQQ